MISSGRYSATASIVGGVGVGVADLADRLDARARAGTAREVDAHLRGVVHGLVVDDVARRGLVRGTQTTKRASPSRPPLLDARRAACRRRASRWRRRGRSSATLASSLAVVVGAAVPAGRRPRRALEDAVHRAGDAVLVGAADDRRDRVEVEDRRRRGDLPLERQRAPRVGRGARPAAPARRPCCRAKISVLRPRTKAQIEMTRFQRRELLGVVGDAARHALRRR